MNLLFYCSEYPPYKAGGIGTVTKIVAEELVRRGHDVSVIGYYPDMMETYSDEIICGVRVVRLNLGYRNTGLKNRLFIMLRKAGLSGFITKRELAYTENKIETYIRDNGIDVLELTDYYPFVLCESELEFRRFSVPTVLRVHGSASFIQNLSGKGRRAYDSNDERHFRRCDHVSSVSIWSMEYIRNNFILPDVRSWNVIYNPVEDSFLKKSDPSKCDDVLFVGKLTRTKGCFSLIKAFNLCAAVRPDIRLKLAGTGDVGSLKTMIDPEYKDRVIFMGYCDRERLKEEIDDCSFACIPSYFENFSMVPLEIMARGKTIIYTSRTSGPEIVDDGIDGFTVDPDDVVGLASKMILLTDDHELRNRMASHAYGKIEERFSMKAIVQNLVDFYSGICD